MTIVLGATGHVGSAVAESLIEKGEEVTIVTRDPERAGACEAKGAKAAIVDVHDADALRALFATGERLFLLNPPAPPSTDTAVEERRSLGAILAAIEGSGLGGIVAQSTYGAQPGEEIGDLGVLYEMEQGLARLGIPHLVLRAAYYLSNWDASLATAREEGVVHTLYPPEFRLPMVAPGDLGRFAAGFLSETVPPTGMRYVEGPGTFSSADVASAFASALGRRVEAVQTPRDGWESTLRGAGFSEAAARSMATMTDLTLSGPEEPTHPLRGETTLRAYIAALVDRA